MPYKLEIAARKPARNYRDPNDSENAAATKKPADKLGNSEPVDDVNEQTRHSDGQSRAGRPAVKKPGGSEQPGYRMKRARFWQS
jgi:hypothetical protein